MRTRHTSERRGMAILDLIMGGAFMFILFLLLAIPILVGSLGRARELSKRTVCAANLKGMGNGFATYATANNDEFPVPAHLVADEAGVGRVRYAPGIIGKHRGKVNEPDAGESSTEDKELSTTRGMWYLVRAGASSPKSFICPSSKDKPNNEDNPQDFWDFRKYSEVSYGYQVPFGKHGKPSPNLDQDMAIAADKGPYSAALEAGRPNPGVPTAQRKDNPDKWRRWNSLNHRSEGQNVMYNDAHVDFVMTPLAGTAADNIYTRWSQADPDELGRIHGTPPTGIETPFGDTDSLIYP